MRSGYVKTTEEMFNRMGCRATYVGPESRARLNIPDNDYEANMLFNRHTDPFFVKKSSAKIHYSINRKLSGIDLCRDGMNVSVKEVLGKAVPAHYEYHSITELGMDFRIGVNGRNTFQVSGDIASFVHTAITDLFERSGCNVSSNSSNAKNTLESSFNSVINSTKIDELIKED
jgi:hypothetical protein